MEPADRAPDGRKCRLTGPIVLEALDDGWSQFRTRLDGLTDDEHLWEPVDDCWTVRPDETGALIADWEKPDPDPAPVTTIAWRMWHLAVDCLDFYSERAFGRTGSGLSGRHWVGAAEPALAATDGAWRVFRSELGEMSEPELARTLGEEWGPYRDHTFLHLALHAHREVVHHGAEIALLRDLYRARAVGGR